MIHFSLSQHIDSAPNIVLIHGLFGDKDNLNVLSRQLQPLYNVMSIDLPDHGQSEHTPGWAFDEVCQRLHATLQQNDFLPCTIIGHSLGGKVAMAYALTHGQHTSGIVVADIAPVPYSPRHQNVFKALNAVDMNSINSRKDAAAVLDEILVEPGTAQFLLKSLKNNEGTWQWQFNLQGLEQDYASVSDWPFEQEQYSGPVAFIKGERSDYINQSHADAIQRHFPAATLKVIGGTGHWLHAEKPSLFNRQVLRILDESIR